MTTAPRVGISGCQDRKKIRRPPTPLNVSSVIFRNARRVSLAPLRVDEGQQIGVDLVSRSKKLIRGGRAFEGFEVRAGAKTHADTGCRASDGIDVRQTLPVWAVSASRSGSGVALGSGDEARRPRERRQCARSDS